VIGSLDESGIPVARPNTGWALARAHIQFEEYLMSVPYAVSGSQVWRRRTSIVALVFLWFGVAPSVFAASTYYVATTGNDSNSCSASLSASSPRKTVAGGVGCLAAGDTLVLGAGTYSGGLANLPNGSAGNYITIKAAADGTVILTGGIGLDHTDAYLTFEGLRFQDTLGRSVLGNHLKFLRCEFKGGCSSGNCNNTTVGSNDYNDTAYILFEDCWFHGAGGRYNLIIYNSNHVVVRRVVIRHDGGWTDGGSENPEAGLMFYNSSYAVAQNVLVIDSNLSYSTWQGSFYMGKNTSSPGVVDQNAFVGSIALVGANLGMRIDNGNGASTNTTVQDCVFWDTVNGGISLGAGSYANTGTINRVTIGRSKLAAAGDMKGGIGQWGSANPTITNVIIANWTTGADLDGLSASYFDTYNNGSSSSNGTGRVTYNPLSSGLSYLTRIETGSALSTAGSGGGQIGARVVNRIGASGTLHGDANWNADTGTSLWPWPNESRIKKEMCSDAGVTRGFCSSTSISDYVWTYLGKANPIGGGTVAAPAAPGNVRIVQ
jgi:hypothetical protein